MKKATLKVEVRNGAPLGSFGGTWNLVELQLDIRELLIGIAKASGVHVEIVKEPKRSGKPKLKRKIV